MAGVHCQVPIATPDSITISLPHSRKNTNFLYIFRNTSSDFVYFEFCSICYCAELISSNWQESGKNQIVTFKLPALSYPY